jgi:hypothetical protein
MLDINSEIKYNYLMMIKKELKMTEFEKNCYGMPESDIREQYMNNITAKLSGLEMVVMGIMSDCQHMIEFGFNKEDVRKQLNVAKFILGEIMESKMEERV